MKSFLFPLLLLATAAHADSLTGRAPKDFYKDLLQVSNANVGVDATLRPVQSGAGTDSAMSLSTSAARFKGQVDFTGVTHAGLKLNGLSTAQRNAITASAGMLIHNATTASVEEYDGTRWVGVSGDITPASVAAVGTVSGSNLTGTNTGDQTITLTGAVVGTGTGSFATAISTGAVTALKMGSGACATNIGTLGGDLSGTLPTPTVVKINGSTPATVATTGLYSDLSGLPTLGTAAAQDSTAFATAAQGTKADGALQASNNLSDLGSASTARTNLGLGTAATTPATNYATSSQGAKADTALQAANNLSDVSSASAARTSLGLGTAATQSSGTFLQAANNLSDVTASTARSNLGLGTSATQSTGTFLQTANNLSDVTAATARTNLGLGTAATQATSAFATAAQGAKADTAIQSPTIAFASLPSASTAGVNARYYVTDVCGGSVFISNGTYWRPSGGVCVLAASGTAASVTGTTSETTLATISIPAGLMTAKGSLRIVTLFSGTTSASNKTPRIRLGGTSGTIYSGISFTTNVAQQSFVQIRNRDVANSQVGFSAGSAAGTGSISSANVTSSVDTASATTVVITGALVSTGDTLTLEGYTAELIIP